LRSWIAHSRVRKIDGDNTAGAFGGDIKRVVELTARCDAVDCAISSTVEAPGEAALSGRSARRPQDQLGDHGFSMFSFLRAPPWIGSRKLAPLERAGAIQKFGSTVSIILRR
jgi:hypothetical protein